MRSKTSLCLHVKIHSRSSVVVLGFISPKLGDQLSMGITEVVSIMMSRKEQAFGKAGEGEAENHRKGYDDRNKFVSVSIR